jgi:hypothetical protein
MAFCPGQRPGQDYKPLYRKGDCKMKKTFFMVFAAVLMFVVAGTAFALPSAPPTAPLNVFNSVSTSKTGKSLRWTHNVLSCHVKTGPKLNNNTSMAVDLQASYDDERSYHTFKTVSGFDQDIVYDYSANTAPTHTREVTRKKNHVGRENKVNIWKNWR